MTEQDTTPQDKTNTSQDNQNTTDNNTPDQTTTQHNAPHYITKSPQHNTKNLPLQVSGTGTSDTPVVNVLGMTELEVDEEKARGYWESALIGAIGRGEIKITEGFELVPTTAESRKIVRETKQVDSVID